MKAYSIAVTCFLVVSSMCPADELKPEVLKRYQEIYVREQTKKLDQMLERMMSNSDTHYADRNFDTLTVPSPGGRRAVIAFSRTSPESMDSWILLVQDTRNGKVLFVFDFLKAFGIEEITWIDEGRFLLHDKSHILSGPPGRLFHFNLVTGRVDQLDDFVWRYAIAPGGDDVIYERNEDPREPYGVRSLYHLRVSTRDRHRIYQVHHPMTQFGNFIGFKNEGSFFKFTVDTYDKNSFEPVETSYWFDLMASRTFKDSPSVSTEAIAPSDAAKDK